VEELTHGLMFNFPAMIKRECDWGALLRVKDHEGQLHFGLGCCYVTHIRATAALPAWQGLSLSVGLLSTTLLDALCIFNSGFEAASYVMCHDHACTAHP
jgi:hypothetical protein